MAAFSERTFTGELPETVRHLHVKQDGFGSDTWVLSERSASPALGAWRMALARPRGTLVLGDRRYELAHARPFGESTMRRRGKAALRATPPSLFSDRSTLRGAGRRLELRANLIRKGSELFEHARRIGRCAPTGWGRTSLRLTVEDDLPLELAVLALWSTWLDIEQAWTM